MDEVRAAAKKDGAGETGDALYAYFLERVRTNLHVILCLSPIGEAFRERCRMFPGLHPHRLLSAACMYHAGQTFEAVFLRCHNREIFQGYRPWHALQLTLCIWLWHSQPTCTQLHTL